MSSFFFNNRSACCISMIPSVVSFLKKSFYYPSLTRKPLYFIEFRFAILILHLLKVSSFSSPVPNNQFMKLSGNNEIQFSRNSHRKIRSVAPDRLKFPTRFKPFLTDKVPQLLYTQLV